MIFFFVYETTNIINGKKYRGIHKTKNLNDGYIGSGFAFEKAVQKYGRENFKREILEFCNSYDELIEKEKIYVDDNWVKNRNNYNLKTGGQSAGILSNESKNKISKTLKEKYKSGKIISTFSKNRKGKTPWNKGVKMTIEHKEKCSKSGKERFENDKNHPFKISPNRKGHNKGEKIGPMKEETKNKISNTLKERWKKEKHPSKGKKGKIPWNKGLKGHKFKKEKNFECPYCGRFLDKVNAKRWHFENCKFKIPS